MTIKQLSTHHFHNWQGGREMKTVLSLVVEDMAQAQDLWHSTRICSIIHTFTVDVEGQDKERDLENVERGCR